MKIEHEYMVQRRRAGNTVWTYMRAFATLDEASTYIRERGSADQGGDYRVVRRTLEIVEEHPAEHFTAEVELVVTVEIDGVPAGSVLSVSDRAERMVRNALLTNKRVPGHWRVRVMLGAATEVRREG